MARNKLIEAGDLIAKINHLPAENFDSECEKIECEIASMIKANKWATSTAHRLNALFESACRERGNELDAQNARIKAYELIQEIHQLQDVGFESGCERIRRDIQRIADGYQFSQDELRGLKAAFDETRIVCWNRVEGTSIVAEALSYIELLPADNRYEVSSTDAAKSYVRLKLCNARTEEFWVIYMNTQNRVIQTKRMFSGGVHSCTVSPREIAREALLCDATAVILVHNHPSGIVVESREDRVLTSAIKAALQLFDIRTLDHLIVGRGNVLSFAEKGIL